MNIFKTNNRRNDNVSADGERRVRLSFEFSFGCSINIKTLACLGGDTKNVPKHDLDSEYKMLCSIPALSPQPNLIVIMSEVRESRITPISRKFGTVEPINLALM